MTVSLRAEFTQRCLRAFDRKDTHINLASVRVIFFFSMRGKFNEALLRRASQLALSLSIERLHGLDLQPLSGVKANMT